MVLVTLSSILYFVSDYFEQYVVKFGQVEKKKIISSLKSSNRHSNYNYYLFSMAWLLLAIVVCLLVFT